jgi:hypothetical protein
MFLVKGVKRKNLEKQMHVQKSAGQLLSIHSGWHARIGFRLASLKEIASLELSTRVEFQSECNVL